MSVRDLWDKLMANPKVRDFVEKNRSILKGIGILLIVVVAAALMLSSHGKEEEVSVEEETVVIEETSSERVCVDIGGEVVNPMVAELDSGCRVEDAIKAAGGLTDKADIADINRAAVVNDGDKIYIPSVDDTLSAGSGNSSEGSNSFYNNSKVNINTADSQELQTLTGVGPATADKIIAYRESNGRFSDIADIKKVSGIGDKTYEKLKDFITT
ncbi:MAG: helix-hairpin-helix domain-containing protein [Bacillota bacterium]|nr:helix-hairpin-helix domain-containing protein [Bacillota bacterium]